MSLDKIRDKLADPMPLKQILDPRFTKTLTSELTQQDLAWLIGQCYDQDIAYKLALLLVKQYQNNLDIK